MTQTYRKACTEVLEVLKHLPTEEVEKIPKDVVEELLENRDNTYYFPIKSLKNEDLKLLPETVNILFQIYTEYFVSDDVKKAVKDILNKK